MFDNRIEVNEIDKSQFVKSGTGAVIGATVIRSPKGTEKPVYFPQGSEVKILQTIGYPNVDYPDVWELLEFNKYFPIYVSAPSVTESRYGGVIVTKTGSLPLTVGIADPDLFDLTQVAWKQLIGTGDGANKTFADVLDHTYVNLSISAITFGSTTIAVTPSDLATEVLTGAGLTSGTLVRATGVLDFVTVDTPALGVPVYVEYKANFSTVAYFYLLTKSPHSGVEKVMTTYSTDDNTFTVKYYIQNNRLSDVLVYTYNVSQIPGTENGFKEIIYVDSIFENDDFLIGASNDLVYTTFTDDVSLIALGAGTRSTAPTITELTAGWDYFKKANTYPAQIFMDFTADDGIPALFNTLRTSYQKYKDYIFPLPIASDVDQAVLDKAAFNLNNRGLQCFFNWRKVKEPYGKTSFWTSQIGNVAVKYGLMANVYNGLSPSGVDENSHGGILYGSVIEMKYDISPEEIETLANAGINAIVFDQRYGAVIAHGRTCQNPFVLSDTTYTGHSRMFDYMISRTIKDVLEFQVDKLNDLDHRTLATRKGETLYNPLTGLSLLRGYLIKCDADNNNDAILAQRKFSYILVVKVTPFSENIVFDFIASAQGVTLESNLPS